MSATTSSLRLALTLCFASSLGLGCAPAPAPDAGAGNKDAGASLDSGPDVEDAGPTDGGAPDGGAPDGGGDAGGPAPFAIHYHRADGSYDGFSAVVTRASGETTIPLTTTDDFGAVFEIDLAGESSISLQITNGAESEWASPLEVALPGDAAGIWHFSGQELSPFFAAPPAIPGDDQVVVYYLRDDDDYEPWGLHTWGDVVQETLWSVPLEQGGVDPQLGAWWTIDVAEGAERVNFIVHAGDEKDPGPDMGFNISELGDMVFMVTGSTDIFPHPVEIPDFAITGARAHWLDRTTIAWSYPDEATSVELRWSQAAEIEVVGADVEGGSVVTLTPDAAGLSEAQRAAWPHLRTRKALKLGDADLAAVPDMLKGELVVVARDASGAALDATTVQIPGVLDDLYTYEGPLGVTLDAGVPEIRVWAPTAQSVRLRHFDEALSLIETVDMTLDATAGVWSYTSATADWMGDYYQYEVTVFHPATKRVETLTATDPYAVSLSANSAHTHIVDLDEESLKPAGWDALSKPPLAAPEDIVVYETHIRDFSAFDETVPAADRGKYLAFTHNGQDGATLSAGMAHLTSLAEAGLTHLHLLPMFDLATIEERREDRVELDDGFDDLCAANPAVPLSLCNEHATTPIQDVLAGLDPTHTDLDGTTAQEIVSYMYGVDGFNWGYDPFHYTVPEGGYASSPDGATRILEMRRMVQALNEVGLRVVMDVVYNHTNASGVGEKSVLDRLVPGYYHRQNPDTGFVERSTCCDNTASEHAMMERLMSDSLVTWAKHYKIDAFRFDLMGHHMKRNMIAVRDRLAALTLAEDGVDGASLYLYGEGWNFGEVANNQRGENAIQENMGGTGIGTFNDRLRDAARGGGAFDGVEALRVNQGYVNGLHVDPVEGTTPNADTLVDLLKKKDLIHLGMAGNLEDFQLIRRDGNNVRGVQVSYNGVSAGYTQDPQEVVNYVSKHDNQTLFDINAYKSPTGTTMDERVRMQAVALATTLLGQGVPFLHMGVDLLRSKSMERDSYDSGDWFNRVDWTYQDNNWNVGLPRKDKDGPNWPLILQILADETIAPAEAHIRAAAAHTRELLRVRKSSPLFRLRTKEEVLTRVHFVNTGPDQIPGLIAMTVSDGACAGADLDPALDGAIVLINADDEQVGFTLAGASGYALHPLLDDDVDADATTRGASFDDGTDTFSVPARTAVVFVVPQGAAQGDAVGCNPLNP